jgi:hypothetical protein
MVEESTKPNYVYDENGEIMLDENGEPMEWSSGSVSMDGWSYDYHTPTSEEVELTLKLLQKARPVSERLSDAVINIIQEEAAAYFQGQKSVEEVADIIQNRLQNYMNESM